MFNVFSIWKSINMDTDIYIIEYKLHTYLYFFGIHRISFFVSYSKLLELGSITLYIQNIKCMKKELLEENRNKDGF